jgi:molecular chaperone GrpE
LADEKKSQVDKKNIQEEKANACSHTDTKQKQPNNEGKAENTNAENTKNVKKKEDAESSEVMKKKLKKTEEELQKQKDILLRTAAEYDNYRKRTEREKTSIYTDATADTIEKILPVADNLERALSQEECTVEDLKKGVEMVNKQLVDALTKLGVTTMGEIGDEFNPELHNAVSHIEDENTGENTISQVFQKGYKIGDKIIRHAMVQVAN